MAQLNLPPLRTVAGFATDKSLEDPSLPSSPVSLGLAPGSRSFSLVAPLAAGKVRGSFSVSVGADVSVAIVNSETDPDADGYFGQPIQYDPTLAYVVIGGVGIWGKIPSLFTIGGPGATGLERSDLLTAGACTAFPRGAMAYASLSAAASVFKTVFSLEELLSAPPPPPARFQVLCLGIRRPLRISLPLAAEHLAALVADALASVYGLSGPFGFAMGSLGNVTGAVGSTAGFRIFAQKTSTGTTFTIKRGLAPVESMGDRAAVSVTGADTALDGLASSIFERLAGKAGPVPPPAEFKAELVRRCAAEMEAQLARAWDRSAADPVVAVLTIPDLALPKYHADLLSLDLSRLMTDGAAEGVIFSRYFGPENPARTGQCAKTEILKEDGGLALVFTWKNLPFQQIVDSVVDHGAILSAWESDDVAAGLSACAAAGLAPEATGDARVCLRIPEPVLRQLLPVMAGPSFLTTIAPYAMARALPFVAGYPERRHVDARTRVYAKIFADFLATSALDAKTIARICLDGLPQLTGSAGLGEAEGGLDAAWTVSQVILNSQPKHLQRDLRRLPASFSLWQGDPSELTKLTETSYGCRILASIFILAAQVEPSRLEHIHRSVQFVWQDEGGPRVVVMSSHAL